MDEVGLRSVSVYLCDPNLPCKSLQVPIELLDKANRV